MSTMTTAQTTQVYSVFVKASPEQVWDAITKPEFTSKYFYGSHVDISPERFRGTDGEGNDLVVGEMFEIDPPRRLVHGWRALYDPETAGEGESRGVGEESRGAWETEPQDGGVCRLTVVHDRLEAAPKTAANVAGGWSYVLSG